DLRCMAHRVQRRAESECRRSPGGPDGEAAAATATATTAAAPHVAAASAAARTTAARLLPAAGALVAGIAKNGKRFLSADRLRNGEGCKIRVALQRLLEQPVIAPFRDFDRTERLQVLGDILGIE